MKLVVITSNRATLERGTLATLVPLVAAKWVIMCPEAQRGTYRRAHPGLHVHPIPAWRCKTLPDAQQYMLENLDAQRIILFDDDLSFAYRVDPKTIGSRLLPIQMSKTQAVDMIDRLSAYLELYAHCTIMPRMENAMVHEPDEVYERKGVACRSVMGLDLNVIRKEKLRFDVCESKGDYHVTLSLLRRGYANILCKQWTHDQCNGPGLAGGCTDYRDDAMHERASKKLASLHPDFVKVIVKKDKSGWGRDRYDVRIQWRKAYDEGVMLYG